ncbi:fibronectin type III-like domain-contianing protein [Nonomuraea ferruginea]
MVRASVTVTNTGPREGVEVVQFYTHQQRSRVKQPLRRLRGFEKVRLAPGESRVVRLDLPVRELACWDVTSGRFVVERAPHRLMVSRSATDLRVTARFEVDGETIPPRRGLLRAVDHDEYDAVTFTEASRENGDAVRADAEGAWILFRQVDLNGAASCLAVLGSTEGGMITLRIGDPPSTGSRSPPCPCPAPDGTTCTPSSPPLRPRGECTIFMWCSRTRASR